jgi:Zinc-binding dehydrogenase
MGGRGVDVAFESAGNDAAVALAVAAARPGGRVILAGIPGQDTTTFPASVVGRKGLTLKRLFANEGVVAGWCVWRVTGASLRGRGRGLPMMEVPTPAIRKTSTCPTLPSPAPT